MLKVNLGANFVGRGLTGVIALLVVPFYIRLIGVEAYGLVGFFLLLQSALSIFDLGIGETLNRELARATAHQRSAADTAGLVRTLEVLCVGIGALCGGAVFLLSPWIAHHWLKPGALSSTEVEQAVRYMGLAFAMQWPNLFYSNGLMGMQRQVLANLLNVGAAIFRAVGAVAVLALVSPTIEAFFIWQAVASCVNTATRRTALWHCLGGSHGARFSLRHLLPVWRFSAGLTGISLTGLLISQVDRVILSKFISLEGFGVYTVATTAASALYSLISPIQGALFPQFSRLATQQTLEPLKRCYHKGCQLMTLALVPCSALMVVFPKPILSLWLHKPAIAESAATVTVLLVLNRLNSGLLTLPYTLQYAHGWTGLVFKFNLAGIFFLPPALIWLAPRYGAVGVAAGNLALDFLLTIGIVWLMHRRILVGEARRWYVQDTGLPLLATFGVVLLWRLVQPPMASTPVELALLAGAGLSAFLVSLLLANDLTGFQAKEYVRSVVTRQSP